MTKQEIWEDVLLRRIDNGLPIEKAVEMADQAAKLHEERFSDKSLGLYLNTPVNNAGDPAACLEYTVGKGYSPDKAGEVVRKPISVGGAYGATWGVTDSDPTRYEITTEFRKMLIEKNNEAIIRAFEILSNDQLEKIIYYCNEVMRMER